jgi:hypothetical protein
MDYKKQEDVDLIFVLKSIKNGIYAMYRSLINLVFFSINNFAKLLIFIVLGLGISLTLYFIKVPVYVSELTLSHIRFDNDYCIELINNLDSYIIEGSDNPRLAEKFGIGKEYTKHVIKISYKPLNQNISRRYADSTFVILPFKVEVEVDNISVLPELQKGIVNYLENNEYASKLKEIDKTSLRQIEVKLDKDLNNLDSLKRILEKSIVPQNTGNGIILGEPINPITVYDISLKLYEKKLQISNKQKMNNSFNVMVGFAESKSNGKGKVYFILIGILIGYFAGLLFLKRKKVLLKDN